MESYRCGQTTEESPAVVEVIVRPDEPPSSQDITVSSSSYCSSSSALRIAENSQSPAVHFVTRTDSADCHMPSVVSRPSQLPMDNRRNSWTQEESTIDNMTTMFSPNFPLSQDIFTSSTSLVSSSSSASLSRVVDYPQLSYTNVFTRPDFTGSHFIAGMNIPPQLPMDDRQLSHGVPLVQDSSIASACFSTSSPFSTLSRVNDYSQSFPMGFIPRVNFRDTRVTSGVNLSPQLPMDNRRESQTAGESTVNTSTAIFRPLNVPAMSAFRSSGALSTLAQSTYPMPRGSAASLPANGASYSRSLPFCAVQTDSSSVSMSAVKQGTPTNEELEELGNEIAEKWVKLGRCLGVKEAKLQDIKQRYEELSERGYHMLMHWKQENGREATYQILNSALQHKLVQRKDLEEQICYNHGKGKRRKRRMSPGCSNQDPKQTKVASGDLAALRIAENSQSPAVHFVTRTDSADCHMPSVVRRPSQLPMDNRRNSWTQGESTFDNMTTMFSPNFPLLQDIYTSSTSLVSSSSSASLSRVVDYPRLSYTNVFTRPDFTGSHFIAGMNIPPQLPMVDRRLSHGAPLVQDSSIALASFSTSSPFSTLSRVNNYSQSLPTGFIPRVDFRDTRVTSGVNLSPQLPMDNRRESQTAGESTVNTSTGIFRPLNVPAMSAFQSSRASSTLAQSTYPMPRGSAASSPANGASYSRPLPLYAVQTDSSSVSMSAEKRKKRMSPGCSNQDPKQPKVASVDLAGTPNNDELQELGKKIGVKWDTLGRCLGVEEPELENIEQRHKDLEKRGYDMLMHWKQKNGSEATYQILKAALQHKLVQRKDLEEQICDNHGIPDVPRNHFDVKVCRRKLAEHYKRTATVPTSVWSKKCSVYIHEIYTRLSLVKEEQTPAGSSQAGLNHYTDVLTENKNGLPSNRILLQGQTGIGKSTFVKKLAMDWAELDENRLTDEQRAILKKFELAVIIDLKKVSKYQNLRDIISASHIFADEDTAMKDGLLSYITHNQDKVLLVFDGYDEYRFGSNSEIFEIFKGNKLRNCCVLITTRISKADELKEFKDVHAEITGFSEKDSLSFMVRMLGDKIQAFALYRHLCKRNLNDMARVPLLLLFFCTLWKKGSARSFPDSKTTLYVAIAQYVLDHNESKCSPANFRKVEDFKEILAEIGKVALECLMKDDHVFEYDQLSPAIRFSEESRIIGLLQVSEYSENLRPAGMVSFIHKSIQEFLAAWYINYRCVPEGNLGEINDRTRTLDDCRSLENVFQFVCGLSDDGAVKVFEHLKSVRISDSELDLSKTIPDGTDGLLFDITGKHPCFITLVNGLFGEVQSKTEVLRHYLNCTDGIIFVERGSVREIIPERRNLNGITFNGVVWFAKKENHRKAMKIYESIEFLDCLDVPLRMTENSVVVAVGEFLRKFEAIRCASLMPCHFTCILRNHNGQAFFYITRLRLHCDNHADLFDVTNLTSTPSHSTSSSSEGFCLKYLSFLRIDTDVNERTMKCLVTIFRDCKNLKNIVFQSVTKHTCELLQYVPNPRSCRVHLGHVIISPFAIGEHSLTSADVTKLAGLLPQFKNLVSLSLNLNNCCAEAVNKLVSSITHKTLEELGLHGIILTPVTAAALGRSIFEMSSLRELSISGPERGFLETNEIEASPTGFDRTSLVSQLFTFNTGGCRFLPSLYALRLEHLNLNERGLRELLDNWKFFSELRYLSLYGNPLGDKRTVHSMVKKALPRVHVFSSITLSSYPG